MLNEEIHCFIKRRSISLKSSEGSLDVKIRRHFKNICGFTEFTLCNPSIYFG